MAMTLAQLLVNLGINVKSYTAGIQQARKQLYQFDGTVKQLSSSIARTAAVNAAFIYGLYQLQSVIRTAFTAGIKAADDFRLATINVAATMTDWLEGDIGTKRASFVEHLEYAKEMYKALELEAVKHFASGRDLQLAWTILVQKGVQLRYEEINALGIVVDKIKLMTQGQMATIQIAQEIRSLLNGQARTTDQIALLLKDKYGKEWKKIVNEHRKAGDLLQWLAQEWEGLLMAQTHVLNTLEAQSTTLWTLIRRVGREGLAGAYGLIVETIKTINLWLIEHEYAVTRFIFKAWESVTPVIIAVGQAIQAALSWVWLNQDQVLAFIGTLSNIIAMLIHVVRQIVAWAMAHSFLLLTLLTLKVGVGIFNSLITVIGVAVVAANKLALALFGITLATNPILTIIGLIAALGLALYGASVGAAALEYSIEKAMKAERSRQAVATGMTQEEFRQMVKYSPAFRAKYGGKLHEIHGQETRYDIKEEEVEFKVYGEGAEAIITTDKKIITKGKFALGPIEKENTEAINSILDSGQGRWIIGKDGTPVFIGADVTAQMQAEKAEAVMRENLAEKKYKQAAVDEEEGKPKSTYPARWKAIRAELKLEIAQWEGYLDKLEAYIDRETAILETRIEAGEATGSELYSKRQTWIRMTLALTLGALEKEREAEKVAFDERMDEINKDPRMSAEKKVQERRTATAQHHQAIAKLDVKEYKARAKAAKELAEEEKKQLEIRLKIRDLLLEAKGMLAVGPIEEDLVVIETFVNKIKDIISEINKMEVKPEFEAQKQELLAKFKLLLEPVEVEWQAIWKDKFKDLTRTLVSGITELGEALLEGGKNLRQIAQNMFKGIFKWGLESSFKWLETTLMGLFKSMFNNLGAGIMAAGAVVLGIIGALFLRETGGTFTPAGATTGITTHEPVRGIIAGSTSIPIAEIDLSLKETMAPHLLELQFIRRILAEIREQGLPLAGDLDIKMDLDGYFADALMTAK